MIDLHSHLLPGVDDGARTLEQSLLVLRQLARDGVTDICLTPHLLATHAPQGMPEAHKRAWATLAPAAPRSIRLHRGAEVMLDRPLGPEVARDRTVTLAGSRYILVEFPRLVAAQPARQALTLVTQLGLVPLLAHPERYSSCSLEIVRWWREAGALMQVDAISLLSSGARGDRARRLVGAGLADVLAADNHGDGRSVALSATALTEQGGGEQATLLLEENPRAIIEDRAPVPVPPIAVKLPLIKRLKDLFGGEE